jgi:hypothetical protein
MVGLAVLANATMAPGGCSQTSSGVTCAPAAAVAGKSGQLNVSSLTFTRAQASATNSLLVLLRKSQSGVDCNASLWTNVTDGCHVGPLSSEANTFQRWTDIALGQPISSGVAITSPSVLAPVDGTLDVFIYALGDKLPFTQCTIDADCTAANARGGHCVAVPGSTDLTGGQRFCDGGTVTLVGGACKQGSFDTSTGTLTVTMTMQDALSSTGGASAVPFSPKCASCSSGKTACATGCSDVSSDANNCGACDNACNPSATCSAGKCVDTAASCTALNADTSTNFSLCGAACQDLKNDDANCGKCGNACPSGQLCVSSACTSCAAPSKMCGTTCTDVTSDSNNCGACGTACPTGQSCNAGKCAACPTGKLSCPVQVCTGGRTPHGWRGGLPNCTTQTACVDPSSDPSNCGGCGNLCLDYPAAVAIWVPEGASSCTAGKCAHKVECSSATAIVNSSEGASAAAGFYPNELTTDANNCGACGNACAAGTKCNNGACGCQAPQTSCGGTCVDTSTDTNNCGACGTACPVGQGCFSGACVDQTCMVPS